MNSERLPIVYLVIAVYCLYRPDRFDPIMSDYIQIDVNDLESVSQDTSDTVSSAESIASQ